MNRLTEKKTSGSWQVKGIPWEKLREGETLTKEVSQSLYMCLCKLKDYEDSGMNPDKLERLQNELEDMAEQVCNKICRHPREIRHQEKLDKICERCPVNICVGRREKEDGNEAD